MQRMIESTVILPIIEKYEKRYKECSEQWDDDMIKLRGLTEQEESDNDRKNFLFNDILALNAQMSAYECIIKDLKGLVK